MRGIGLVDDRAHAVRPHNGPREERDAACWGEVCFDGEKVTDLVDGEPEGRQGAQPEEEETGELHRRHAGTLGDVVGDILVAGPDRFDHQGDTLTYFISFGY